MNKINNAGNTMNKSAMGWRILLMIAILALTACDSMDAFIKKDKATTSASGTAKSSGEVAGKAEAIRAHELEVQRLQAVAETMLSANDLGGAEEAYQSLEKYDPGNLRAAEGLRRIETQRHHLVLLQEAKNYLGKSDVDDDRAAALLRGILTENPDNQEARSLYHELTVQHEAKRVEAMRKKLVYSNPVTLEFRDVPIKVIIEAIAKGTGTNIILDKDVQSSQKATLFVKSVSLEDAIDLLAQTNQLKKKVLNEKSVILYPNTVIKQREYQDLVIRSFYLEYADPKIVSGLLKTMLGIKQVQIDDRLPLVMIKDVPEIMALAEKLIASQDVPDPEVMIEFQVLEVGFSNSLNTGFTWPNTLTVIGSSATTGSSTSSSSQLTLQQLLHLNSSGIVVSPNPSISLAGTDSTVSLLANPRIRIKNKEKAHVHIGNRVPVITANFSSTGASTENVQYIDVGLKLEVEPLISLGGDVSLKLDLDVSSLGTQTVTANGAVVYQVGTRNTNTQLRLRDGETQVLAGLISDEDRKNINKLAGLGDIPLLGRLFSNHADDKLKSEIVLTVTPHIVRERPAPQADIAEYWSGSEAQSGRSFTEPLTREGISKMFVPGNLPAAPVAPAKSQAKPQGLNIPLPAGMTTPLDSGPGTLPESNE